MTIIFTQNDIFFTFLSENGCYFVNTTLISFISLRWVIWPISQLKNVDHLGLPSNLIICQLSCLVFLSDTFQFDGFILSPVSAFPLKFQSFVNISFIAFQEINKLSL